jgi:single-strand DNA-binding protein
MLNDTRVTLRGNVATEPTLRVTQTGTTVCSFRLAVTERRYDDGEQKMVDAGTSWYTVSTWRGLAPNVAASLSSGTTVIVQGRLRIRDYTWEEQPRTSADVDADAVGVDLAWGTARFTPNRRSARAEAAGQPDGAPDGAPSDDVDGVDGVEDAAGGAPLEAVEDEELVGAGSPAHPF